DTHNCSTTPVVDENENHMENDIENEIDEEKIIKEDVKENSVEINENNNNNNIENPITPIIPTNPADPNASQNESNVKLEEEKLDVIEDIQLPLNQSNHDDSSILNNNLSQISSGNNIHH